MLPLLRYRLEAHGDAAVCVHAAHLVDPADRFELTFDLGPGQLRPGLINAHDHLHRNHYPRLRAPHYPDSYTWGADLHARWGAQIERCRAFDRTDALRFGALKSLLGGAMTMVHHDRWEPAFDSDFPVRVARVRCVHSVGLEPELAAHPPGDPALPLCIHLAEGTTSAVADEVRTLDRVGLLDERLLAVHAVGVDRDGVERLSRVGAAVIWCPTSNDFLFGCTASTELLAPGMDVLLGSDALLTGAGTILDELRAARAYGAVDDVRLEAAVGTVATRRLDLPPSSLSPGAPVDVVHLARPLFEASAEDVALVIVGGVPRLGDERFAELFERAGVRIERLAVGQTPKLVAAPLASVAERVVTAWSESRRILRESHQSIGPVHRAKEP